YWWSWKIESHEHPKLVPEVIVEVAHVVWVYRDESDVVSPILGHLPTHSSYIVVSSSRVRRIYKAPVFDDQIVLWKIEVGLAYLALEYEPVIAHRPSFIIVSNTVISQVIRNNSLSFAPDLLTSQSDRWYPILLRGLEDVIQPGEEAQPR